MKTLIVTFKLFTQNIDIIRPTFDDKKKKELAQRLSKERAKTTREKTIKTPSGKPINSNQVDEYGWTNNEVFLNFLRTSELPKKDKTIKKKELRWNQRFAVPISTYNEAVFRKYRLSFEEI